VIIADFDAISLAKHLCLLFGFSIDQTLAPAVTNFSFPPSVSFIAFQLIAVLAFFKKTELSFGSNSAQINFATCTLCSISIVSFQVKQS
jgi:hypothetical protein